MERECNSQVSNEIEAALIRQGGIKLGDVELPDIPSLAMPDVAWATTFLVDGESVTVRTVVNEDDSSTDIWTAPKEIFDRLDNAGIVFPTDEE